MSSEQIKQSWDDIIQALEELRGRAMDLEAMAHAAAEALEHLPYVPRGAAQPDRGGERAEGDELRRTMGRLQSMVLATAEAARGVLEEIELLLDRAESQAMDMDEDNGSGGTLAHEPRALYRHHYALPAGGGISATGRPAARYHAAAALRRRAA